MSIQQQAQKLALETLSELYKDTSSTASILRRCLAISNLLGDKQERDWIKNELEGYKQNVKFEELKRIVPDYRNVKPMFRDKYDRPIVFTNQLSFIQEDVVTEPIGQIEDSLENGLTYLSGGVLQIAKEVGAKFGREIETERIETLPLKNIIEQVRNRALDFINRVLREQCPTEISEGEKKAINVHESKPFVKFVDYETEDPLLEAHIEEINKTYMAECYTATFLLCRKVLENLIIHSVIKKKYSDRTKEHREKYFDFVNNRNLDFNVLLSNLRKSSGDFAPENKLVERICQLADGFKEDANEMTHSLYHIATKKEIDEKGFQNILNLIKRLEDELAKPKIT